MSKVIRFSTEHPIPILMCTLFFVLMGIFSAFVIKADFLPILQKRNLLVSAEYEGITAKEIKNLVTIPLEDALGSLGGVKEMTSVSRDGVSLISIEFHWGIDIDMALVECREIIDTTFSVLPARCKKPTVKAIDSINESITIAMIPLDNDLKYGRYIADYDIKPRLQRINGVGAVSVIGGEKDLIEVRVEKDKMDSKQLTLESIANAISATNFEYPAGTINEGEKTISVKTSGLYTNINEISKTPILYNEGGLVRISDIAEVVDTILEKETFFIYNGQECIKIGIKKKNDASPINVSNEIKKELEVLKNTYGKYYFFTVINDLSNQVKASILSLFLSALIGGIVAALVIYYFLSSLKISIIISTVIPICCLISLCVLYVFGKSINIMSLSGLAIGIGMVVDCSAVVIENIQKKIIVLETLKEERCCSDKEIIIKGTEEVALSNIGSTLTTAVVFIPVFFLQGILGELFIDLSIAITSSIVASCVLSLTYVPTMCSLCTNSLKKNVKERKLVEYLKARYNKHLIFLFKRNVFVLLIGLILVCLGVCSFCFINFEILPTLSSNTIVAEIIFPQSFTLENIQKNVLYIQNDLEKLEYINSISIDGGVEKDDYEYLALPSSVKEKVRFTVVFKGKQIEKEKIISIFNSLRYEVFITSKTDLLSEILSMNNNDYIIMADSEEELRNAIKKLSCTDFKVYPNYISSEYNFVPDRISNARFSVSALSTANFAYSILEGINAAPFYKEGREIPIHVKVKKDSIKSIEDLENSYIQIENNILPLRSFGKFELKQNEKILYRYNRKDAKILQNIKTEIEESETLISLKELDMKEMIGDGTLLVLIVILLLYLIMGAQFESFLIPIFLMIALPPAFAGAFFSLAIFNQSLNINSIIALVILFGTSVNNTILLYEVCISHKKITSETIIDDCVSKIRSLLVTNFTTIFALVPFAIDPNHINAQSSMSLAIIGGLLVSLIIVLFVIPIIFSKVLINRKIDNE